MDHRVHENNDVIIQRIYQNTTGFHSDDDANDLHNDVAFKSALDKNTLASRSKISRVNTQLDKENVEQFQ
jgi:hypothetical protein